MAHYDWSCVGCDFQGDIYDASAWVSLNKDVFHPSGGGSARQSVELCTECFNKLKRNTGIRLWNTDQFIDLSNVTEIK